MPKKVFFPLTLVTFGLLFAAALSGYLPQFFVQILPIIAIVAGLGGVLLSDKNDWEAEQMKKKTSTETTKKPAKKTSRSKKKK